MRVSISTLVAGLLSAQASLAEPISLFGVDMTMSNSQIRTELESRDFTCVDGDEQLRFGLKGSVFSCSRENTEGASPSIVLYDEQHDRSFLLTLAPAYFGQRLVTIDCEVANLCQLPMSEVQEILQRHSRTVTSFMLPEGANLQLDCSSGTQGELLCTPWTNMNPLILLYEGSLGLPPTSPTFD